jgi:hypothetical protein
MARTLPTYTVEIAWSGNLTGVFTLDRSTLDGTDVLAGSFGQNVFDTVSSSVKSARITRGRTSDLAVMEQGTCTLILDDPHGTYNPENPTSSLAGYLVPMRPVRVRATHLGTTYGLFYGFISKIVHDPSRSAQQTTIEAVDLFEWLNYSAPTIASTGSTTVGAAIGLLLDALEWSDPTLRSLCTGRAIPDFSADGATSPLQLIANLLQVDLGAFFIDGDGAATYLDADVRFAARSAAGTLTGIVSGALPGMDKDRIRNRWTVTRTGGVAQTAADDTSRKMYGYRDGTPIESAYLVDDNQAGTLANFLIAAHKDPRSPTRSVEVLNRDDTAIGQQLARELGDRVTFTESGGGTNIEAIVERIEHEITPPPGIHRTRYLLSKRTFDAFTLDVSTLDGTHLIGY